MKLLRIAGLIVMIWSVGLVVCVFVRDSRDAAVTSVLQSTLDSNMGAVLTNGFSESVVIPETNIQLVRSSVKKIQRRADDLAKAVYVSSAISFFLAVVVLEFEARRRLRTPQKGD